MKKRRYSRKRHDESYKNLFSHPEMVESLIRDFVPEEWVQQLDFSTLEKQGGSYVSDDLRERHDDIVWRVKCMGEWFYVYLLIEFQSTVDPWMSLRVYVYTGLLYQDLIKSEKIKCNAVKIRTIRSVPQNSHFFENSVALKRRNSSSLNRKICSKTSTQTFGFPSN